MRRLLSRFAIDTRTLALMRVGVGALSVVDVVLRARDLTAHYSDRGVLPRAVVVSGQIPQLGPSFHLVSGDVRVQALLFALHTLAGLCLLVGYRTRLATIAVWSFTISLAARNPCILNGGDRVLRLILFWAMFLPWAERASLDRLLGGIASERRDRVLSFASAGLLVQGFVVYFVSGVLKTTGDAWWNGTAIYYSLSLDHFALPLGEALLQYPSVLSVLTYSVLLLEIGGPLLLFSPVWTDRCRMLVIGALIAFQAGLAATMALGLFPWATTLLLLAYLPGSFWDWIAKGPARRIVPATASLLERISAGWRGTPFRDLPRRGPVPTSGAPRLKSFAERPVAAFFLVLLVVLNVRQCAPSARRFEGEDWLVRTASFDQDWGMFRTPGEWGLWAVVAGQTADGRWIDLRNGAVLDLSRPRNPMGIYPNRRWATLFEAAARNESVRKHVAPGITNYFCREWNERHPREVIERAVAYAMWEKTLLDGRHPAPRVVVLHDRKCSS